MEILLQVAVAVIMLPGIPLCLGFILVHLSRPTMNRLYYFVHVQLLCDQVPCPLTLAIESNEYLE